MNPKERIEKRIEVLYDHINWLDTNIKHAVEYRDGQKAGLRYAIDLLKHDLMMLD